MIKIYPEFSLYQQVFVLAYVQFDKRKLTAGYFKLHRLLYFIRAVDYPSLTKCCNNVGVG